jgi:hypothetical protein
MVVGGARQPVLPPQGRNGHEDCQVADQHGKHRRSRSGQHCLVCGQCGCRERLWVHRQCSQCRRGLVKPCETPEVFLAWLEGREGAVVDHAQSEATCPSSSASVAPIGMSGSAAWGVEASGFTQDEYCVTKRRPVRCPCHCPDCGRHWGAVEAWGDPSSIGDC